MATTTNYSWTTPDNTALVKDGAAAIRSLGTSVDTTTKALNPSTTLGDIEYRSSTANTNTRLGIGSTGQVLTVAGGVPSWAAAPSKVVQIVNVTYATETGINGTTADTGLTATITPTSASNNILVFFSQFAGTRSAGYVTTLLLRRGTTQIGSRYASEFLYQNGGSNYIIDSISGSYLDSPATTSATTYSTRATASGSTFWQYGNSQSTMTLMEVTP